MSSESHRSKADACGRRARESQSLEDIRHSRRLKQSYLALAAWLAGEVRPHDEVLAPRTEGGGSHA